MEARLIKRAFKKHDVQLPSCDLMGRTTRGSGTEAAAPVNNVSDAALMLADN